MDPLSQLIALLQPRSLLWKSMASKGRWSRKFPANRGVVFCAVTAGECLAMLPGDAARHLAAGDFILLAAPPAWELRSHGSSSVRLLGGHFSLAPANADLLVELLPRLIEVRAGPETGDRLHRLVELIGEEAAEDRPGRALMLERLVEAMLVEAIRRQALRPEALRPGLLAGLADPQVALALRAIHGDARQAWTVDRLAALAAMSRSAFADRFTRVVGRAPIGYLLQWRMALARNALRAGKPRLDALAASLGYGSASAFSTAFSRAVGCSPARFASRPELQPQ